MNIEENDTLFLETNILDDLNPTWLLWAINATHPSEINQFSTLYKYMNKAEKTSINIDTLKDIGIFPLRSSLIKKLNNHKFATLIQNTFTFKKREIKKNNLDNYLKELNADYTELVQNSRAKKMNLPCPHFIDIDKSLILDVELNKINSRHVRTSNKKLVKINFPDNSLPPVIIPIARLDILPTICANQIIYQISKQAAENSDFFNRKIEVDKKKMSIQYPRLFDIDMQRLNKATARDYRESYTAMVMEKMFSNSNLIKLFLNDFNSETNPDILRLFPLTSSFSYIFLQAYEILKEIYLLQEENEKYNISEIYGYVFDSFKFFVYESEIYVFLKDKINDLDEQYFQEIIDQFSEEYIYKKNKYGISQIVTFKVTREDKFDEDIYMHFHNINKYLTTNFEKIIKKIETDILEKWENSLRIHNLEAEMFDENKFKEKIFEYIEDQDAIFYQVLDKKILYRMLEGIDNLSAIATRLKLYEKDQIDKVLSISHTDTYRTAFQNVSNSHNSISKVFFILINWFVKFMFHKNRKTQENLTAKSKSIINGQSNQESNLQNQILNSLNLSENTDLKKESNKLWEQIPSTLSREQLEKNIYNDLLDYFKNKNSVKLDTLEFIIEKNIQRITAKANYLDSYLPTIEKFIEYKIYIYILETSSLRSKIE